MCANRIYVQEGIHDQYIEKLIKVMKKELKSGDPMDHHVTFGPMINEKAILKVGGSRMQLAIVLKRLSLASACYIANQSCIAGGAIWKTKFIDIFSSCNTQAGDTKV